MRSHVQLSLQRDGGLRSHRGERVRDLPAGFRLRGAGAELGAEAQQAAAKPRHALGRIAMRGLLRPATARVLLPLQEVRSHLLRALLRSYQQYRAERRVEEHVLSELLEL